MSTAKEVKAAIDTLSTDERAELGRLLRETCENLDPEKDSPELESELLKAIDGPFLPYSSEDMRAVVERIIREEERR